MPFRDASTIAVPLSSGATDNPGAMRWVADASGNVGRQVRLFVPSGATLAIGTTRLITYVGAVSGNPQVAAPASGTALFSRLAVAAESIASGAWGWFWDLGYCQMLVEGTTDVAAADFLKSVAGTSTTALIKDSSTRSANSAAIAMAAQTANSEVLTLCYLLGDQFTSV